jgi:3-hydroxyacyl-CoA dehydrogenase
MPLLEIVRAEQPMTPTLATAFAVGKSLKKSCVLVKDAPAFVVNRLLTRFLGEVTRSVDEGTPFEVADRALDPLGLPMPPFTCCSSWARPWPSTCRRRCRRPTRSGSTSSDNLKKVVEAGKTAIWIYDSGRHQRGRSGGRRAVHAGRRPH